MLLDPCSAPAPEFYHSRRQIETAFAAFKSDLKDDRFVLPSKTLEGAEQGCWALLRTDHATRELICAAAVLSDQDLLRISFVNALDAVRARSQTRALFPSAPDR